MQTAANASTRNQATRFNGGFDRWDVNARDGWSVLWRASEHAAFALGEDKRVWVWDEVAELWSPLPGDEQEVVLREHELTMRNLRRAIPVLRLFLDGSVGAEKEAARAALGRIGGAIADLWRQGRTADQLKRGEGWIDHPAAIYRAIAGDCRFLMDIRPPLSFDPTVFAELVAKAEEDFRAGRRTHPPRLRPRDFAGLQANLAARTPPARAPFPQQSATPARGAAFRPAAEEARPVHAGARLDLNKLREDYSQDMEAADISAREKQLRRKRLLMGSGVAAASLLLVALISQLV